MSAGLMGCATSHPMTLITLRMAWGHKIAPRPPLTGLRFAGCCLARPDPFLYPFQCTDDPTVPEVGLPGRPVHISSAIRCQFPCLLHGPLRRQDREPAGPGRRPEQQPCTYVSTRSGEGFGRCQSASCRARSPWGRHSTLLIRSQRDNAALGFSFSPAGLLFPYHLGVATRLREAGIIRPRTPLAGSSAGALAAVMIGKTFRLLLQSYPRPENESWCAVASCRLLPDCLPAGSGIPKERVLEACFRINAEWSMANFRAPLRDLVQRVLDEILPMDAHERL